MPSVLGAARNRYRPNASRLTAGHGINHVDSIEYLMSMTCSAVERREETPYPHVDPARGVGIGPRGVAAAGPPASINRTPAATPATTSTNRWFCSPELHLSHFDPATVPHADDSQAGVRSKTALTGNGTTPGRSPTRMSTCAVISGRNSVAEYIVGLPLSEPRSASGARATRPDRRPRQPDANAAAPALPALQAQVTTRTAKQRSRVPPLGRALPHSCEDQPTARRRRRSSSRSARPARRSTSTRPICWPGPTGHRTRGDKPAVERRWQDRGTTPRRALQIRDGPATLG